MAALSPVERDELRTTARTLLERSAAPDRVRRVVLDADASDRDLWTQIVGLGWTSIHVDERLGGGGCGFTDLAVVVHELGRALAPTPFLASAVLATGALSLADNVAAAEPALAAVAGGSAIGTAVLASTGGSYDPASATVRWRTTGSSVQLDGEAGYVLDADIADILVVAAGGEDGAAAVVVVDARTDGVRVRRAATVDESRRLFTVSFDHVTVPQERLLCDPGVPSVELIDRILSLAVVAAAGDATGAAERILEVTAQYARERMQFGKPIGSFQAVKHHCADMAIAVEASRAAVAAAAETLDGESSAWPSAASIVASYVGPACSRVCGLAMRVHGGIGFTWEHDTHLFLKRVKLDEVLFGTPAWHRRRLADRAFPTLVGS